MRSGSSQIRAIVTDIDGTLTDAGRRIDLTAIRLLRKIEASGRPVILATGNVLPITLALHRSIGLSGPIVAENGGLIYHCHDGQESVVRLADRAPALRAYREIRKRGLPVRPLFTNRWRESEVALEPTISIARLRPIARRFGVCVESTGFAIHLMEAGAGKLPALRAALAPLGLVPQDCLVAGDGDNDVPMLRSAAFGVSFPTASPRARRAATYVSRAEYALGFVEGLKASGVGV